MRNSKKNGLFIISFGIIVFATTCFAQNLQPKTHVISYDIRGKTKEKIKDVLGNVMEGDDILIRFYASSIFDPYDKKEYKEVIKNSTPDKLMLCFLYPRITMRGEKEDEIYPIRPDSFYALVNKDIAVELKIYEKDENLIETLLGERLPQKINNIYVVKFSLDKAKKVRFTKNAAFILKVLPKIKTKEEISDKITIRIVENMKDINISYKKNEEMREKIPFGEISIGMPYLEAQITKLKASDKFSYYIAYSSLEGKEIPLTDAETFGVLRSPSRLRMRAGPLIIGDGRRATFGAQLLILLKRRSIDEELPLAPWKSKFYYRLNPTVGSDKEGRILMGMSLELNSYASFAVGGRFGGNQIEPFGWGKNLYYGVMLDPAILSSLRNILEQLY